MPRRHGSQQVQRICDSDRYRVLVERRFVAFFAPREVLNSQTRYIRHYMRKPFDVSTRRYVGAVHTLNNALEQLPPSFDASQKILDSDMMDILASNAPKKHKELMTDQGFDPQTAMADQFVEICERAETKAALRTKSDRNRSDDDSSEEECPNKKSNKKHRMTNSVVLSTFISQKNQEESQNQDCMKHCEPAILRDRMLS